MTTHTHTINTAPEFNVNKLVSRNRLAENIYKARIRNGNQLTGRIHVRDNQWFDFDNPEKLQQLIKGYQKDYDRAFSDDEKSRLDAELAEKIILWLGLQIHFNSQYDHISNEEGAKQLKACLEGLRNVKGYENIQQVTEKAWEELVVAMAEETVVEDKPETEIDAKTIATAMISALFAVLHLQWQKQEEQDTLIKKLTEAINENAKALTNLKATLESQWNTKIDFDAIIKLFKDQMKQTFTINWDSQNKGIIEEITKEIEKWIKNWCEEINNFFDKINDIIKNAAKDNEKMTQKIDELTTKVDGLNTKIQELQDKIRSQQENTSKDQNDLQSIQTLFNEIKNSKEEKKDEINALKGQESTASSSDNEISTKLSALEDSMQTIETAISKLAKQLANLGTDAGADQPDQNSDKERETLKTTIESEIEVYDKNTIKDTINNIAKYFWYQFNDKNDITDFMNHISCSKEDEQFIGKVNSWLDLIDKRYEEMNSIKEDEKNTVLKEFKECKSYKNKQALEKAIAQVEEEKKKLKDESNDDEETPKVTEDEIKEIVKTYDANTVVDNLNKIITYYKLNDIDLSNLSSRDQTKQEIEKIKESITWNEQTDKDTKTWIENIIKQWDKQDELEKKWKDENGNRKGETPQDVKDFCDNQETYKSAKDLLAAINAMDQFLKKEEEKPNDEEIKALVETRTKRIATIEGNLQQDEMAKIWKDLMEIYSPENKDKNETLEGIQKDKEKLSKGKDEYEIGSKIENLCKILSKDTTLYEIEGKFLGDPYENNKNAQKWKTKKQNHIKKLKTMALNKTDQINQRCADADGLIQEAETITPEQQEDTENLPEIVEQRKGLIGKIETFTETGEEYVNAAIKLLEEQDAYKGKDVVKQLKAEVEVLEQEKWDNNIKLLCQKVSILYRIIKGVTQLKECKEKYQVINEWKSGYENAINRIANKEDTKETTYIHVKRFTAIVSRENNVDALIKEAKQCKSKGAPEDEQKINALKQEINSIRTNIKKNWIRNALEAIGIDMNTMESIQREEEEEKSDPKPIIYQFSDKTENNEKNNQEIIKIQKDLIKKMGNDWLTWRENDEDYMPEQKLDELENLKNTYEKWKETVENKEKLNEIGFTFTPEKKEEENPTITRKEAIEICENAYNDKDKEDVVYTAGKKDQILKGLTTRMKENPSYAIMFYTYVQKSKNTNEEKIKSTIITNIQDVNELQNRCRKWIDLLLADIDQNELQNITYLYKLNDRIENEVPIPDEVFEDEDSVKTFTGGIKETFSKDVPKIENKLFQNYRYLKFIKLMGEKPEKENDIKEYLNTVTNDTKYMEMKEKYNELNKNVESEQSLKEQCEECVRRWDVAFYALENNQGIDDNSDQYTKECYNVIKQIPISAKRFNDYMHNYNNVKKERNFIINFMGKPTEQAITSNVIFRLNNKNQEEKKINKEYLETLSNNTNDFKMIYTNKDFIEKIIEECKKNQTYINEKGIDISELKEILMKIYRYQMFEQLKKDQKGKKKKIDKYLQTVDQKTTSDKMEEEYNKLSVENGWEKGNKDQTDPEKETWIKKFAKNIRDKAKKAVQQLGYFVTGMNQELRAREKKATEKYKEIFKDAKWFISLKEINWTIKMDSIVVDNEDVKFVIKSKSWEKGNIYISKDEFKQITDQNNFIETLKKNKYYQLITKWFKEDSDGVYVWKDESREITINLNGKKPKVTIKRNHSIFTKEHPFEKEIEISDFSVDSVERKVLEKELQDLWMNSIQKLQTWNGLSFNDKKNNHHTITINTDSIIFGKDDKKIDISTKSWYATFQKALWIKSTK